MRLESVVNHYGGGIGRLARFYRSTIGAPFRQRDVVVAHTCIEALNFWSEFCRRVIQCVMTGGTIRGVPTTWALTPGNWLDVAATVVKPRFAGGRRDEPKWFDPRVLSIISGTLKFSNAGQIRNALGAQTRVLQDLPCARNFFAHRNEDTKKSATELYRHYGVAYSPHPTLLLESRLPNGCLLLEEWLIDLELVVRMFL